jgi:hypothetical protein
VAQHSVWPGTQAHQLFSIGAQGLFSCVDSCSDVQIKQGLDPEMPVLPQSEPIKPVRDTGAPQRAILLRMWGLMTAITHRIFGLYLGGDMEDLLIKTQQDLQKGEEFVNSVGLVNIQTSASVFRGKQTYKTWACIPKKYLKRANV